MRKAKMWLNSLSEGLAPKTKKIILLSCCFLVGAYAIGLITGSVRYDLPEQQRIIRPFIPGHIERSTTDDIRHSIAKFRSYMDSLGTTVEGRRQRDSIIINHPGLMDTIARLEKLINH